jgi:hypothetical protein
MYVLGNVFSLKNILSTHVESIKTTENNIDKLLN